jgi:hypothetical protein
MSIDAAYAAYTDACTLFLDENGICVRVILTRRAPDETTLGGRTRARAADRCVGAQYVASIDRSVAGGLVSTPQAGAPMLFAYLGADGRIGVIRTGPLVRFENLLERTTLRPDGEEARSGAYAAYATRTANATEPFDDDGGTTLPQRRPARPVRPPAAPWQALRRAAGMQLGQAHTPEPPPVRPVRSAEGADCVRPIRDSAPTWKDVQAPRRAARAANGKR